MSRAVLSAGTNVGDWTAHLRSVVDGFADHLVAVSHVFTTAPWGGVDQDDFHNITLIADGPYSPSQWLAFGARLEQAAHRTREIRWGPRTLDVDVISVTDDAGRVVVSDDPVLTLPHPRAAERAFVLVPWRQIDPDATLWTPDGMRAVDDLIDALDPDEVAGVRESGPLVGIGR
ncbi:2-amino-4-hydroxy-6-hydroxymethyldihydropteridine diphosphokinase [Gordonia sp. ABSL1-1]|uniref:2-amino-4-hydroxy-6- hydroxymethyldihydropteridine diphosphokinase n=1 Tax=Gordonia sp. ABSL1-1 TaxID=3053923 RepID=UPI00257285BA|nr:2-amino-4-hydroxy-6-hydroxymethyldihydropteridine diphosphokinase [Gordonia sp. ABSL1-1]MDL9938601.1 2-amino-4-hydroxy-6-hydroxymethyldihydropteridine diphosphokinase [Gordonia sp. ABSL1-1]